MNRVKDKIIPIVLASALTFSQLSLSSVAYASEADMFNLTMKDESSTYKKLQFGTMSRNWTT